MPNPDHSHHDDSLVGLVDTVLDAAKAPVVSLADIIDAVGRASFAPVLLLPALAVASPLSGIPLFSSLMGVAIVLVASQMLAGRRQLWLPHWIMRRSVRGATVRAAFSRIKPVVAWIDNRSRRRWRIFAHRPLIYVPQTLCLLSGLTMPFLEFVPFSSSALGAGVALLAIGMLSRDGLITLLALLPYAGLIWLILRVV